MLIELLPKRGTRLTSWKFALTFPPKEIKGVALGLCHSLDARQICAFH